MHAHAEQVTPREVVYQSGIDAARNLIRTSFENPLQSDDKLTYHTIEHSREVALEAEAVLKILAAAHLVEPSDVELGKLVAWYHDTVQRWHEEDGIRRRELGDNERQSADRLLAFMNQHPDQFSVSDRQKAKDGIMATEPFFNPDDSTVHQPNVERDTTWFSRAIAMADLGSVGSNTRSFIAGGLKLFREENLDIMRSLREGIGALSPEQQDAYAARMRKHLRSQANFARTQEARFTRYFIEPLCAANPSVAQQMINHFSQFGLSREAAEENARASELMTFDALVAVFGYEASSY